MQPLTQGRLIVFLFTLLVLVSLLFTPPAEAIDYSFYSLSTFDDPDGVGTTNAIGANNDRVIVGFFSDASGNHGFLKSGDSFTTYDVPQALPGTTEVNGINGRGELVGVFGSSAGTKGFVNISGLLTPFEVPGAVPGTTLAHGINNVSPVSQIVGTYVAAGKTQGYMLSDNVFMTIGVPSDTPTITFPTQANAVNDVGAIVGTFRDINGDHGYVWNGSLFQKFDVDLQGTLVTDTQALGINNHNLIVGQFSDAFLGETRGFLYDGSIFTPIDIPDATFTQAFGINDRGDIVGSFGDATGKHGFLLARMTAVPEPTSAALFATATLMLVLHCMRRLDWDLRPRSNFIEESLAWTLTLIRSGRGYERVGALKESHGTIGRECLTSLVLLSKEETSDTVSLTIPPGVDRSEVPRSDVAPTLRYPSEESANACRFGAREAAPVSRACTP